MDAHAGTRPFSFRCPGGPLAGRVARWVFPIVERILGLAELNRLYAAAGAEGGSDQRFCAAALTAMGVS